MSNLNPEILAELKKGNTSILNSLPPILRVQYGLALREEEQESKLPINDKDLATAMLERLKNGEVKERLIKEIKEREEQESKEATE